MKELHRANGSSTRRIFLRNIPVAIAGGVVMGFVLGRPFLSKLLRRRTSRNLPVGSIFTPDNKNTRT